MDGCDIAVVGDVGPGAGGCEDVGAFAAAPESLPPQAVRTAVATTDKDSQRKWEKSCRVSRADARGRLMNILSMREIGRHKPVCFNVEEKVKRQGEKRA
jgi:hypothetical protein